MNKFAIRDRITKILIYTPIVLGEAHTVFNDDDTVINPWIGRDMPIDLQWFTLFLCFNLMFVVLSFTQLRLSRLKCTSIRVAAWTVFIMSLVNMFFFLYDFNHQKHYLIIYAGLFIGSEVIAGVIKFDNSNDIIYILKTKWKKMFGRGTEVQ